MKKFLFISIVALAQITLAVEPLDCSNPAVKYVPPKHAGDLGIICVPDDPEKLPKHKTAYVYDLGYVQNMTYAPSQMAKIDFNTSSVHFHFGTGNTNDFLKTGAIDHFQDKIIYDVTITGAPLLEMLRGFERSEANKIIDRDFSHIDPTYQTYVNNLISSSLEKVPGYTLLPPALRVPLQNALGGAVFQTVAVPIINYEEALNRAMALQRLADYRRDSAIEDIKIGARIQVFETGDVYAAIGKFHVDGGESTDPYTHNTQWDDLGIRKSVVQSALSTFSEGAALQVRGTEQFSEHGIIALSAAELHDSPSPVNVVDYIQDLTLMTNSEYAHYRDWSALDSNIETVEIKTLPFQFHTSDGNFNGHDAHNVGFTLHVSSKDICAAEDVHSGREYGISKGILVGCGHTEQILNRPFSFRFGYEKYNGAEQGEYGFQEFTSVIEKSAVMKYEPFKGSVGRVNYAVDTGAEFDRRNTETPIDDPTEKYKKNDYVFSGQFNIFFGKH